MIKQFELFENKHKDIDPKKYMKFEDLEFKKHHLSRILDETDLLFFHDGGKPLLQAKMKFENGYGISVLLGDLFYSNGIDTYEVMLLGENGRFLGEPLGYLSKDDVSDEMLKLQRRKPPMQKFTEEDPYGEEDWSEEFESNVTNGDEKLTTIQLWYRYIRFGRKETIDGFRKNILEFKTNSKGLKEYKGRIIGFYPMYNKKTKEIIILFDTKEYGTLKVNNEYPIIIKSELNEHINEEFNNKFTYNLIQGYLSFLKLLYQFNLDQSPVEELNLMKKDLKFFYRLSSFFNDNRVEKIYHFVKYFNDKKNDVMDLENRKNELIKIYKEKYNIELKDDVNNFILILNKYTRTENNKEMMRKLKKLRNLLNA